MIQENSLIAKYCFRLNDWAKMLYTNPKCEQLRYHLRLKVVCFRCWYHYYNLPSYAVFCVIADWLRPFIIWTIPHTNWCILYAQDHWLNAYAQHEQADKKSAPNVKCLRYIRPNRRCEKERNNNNNNKKKKYSFLLI